MPTTIFTHERIIFSPTSTISRLTLGDRFICNLLEDKDRGLTSEMSLEEIAKIKVPKQTAIPYGQYQLIINMSQRFRKMMPLLLNVKGYTGIRVHSGTTAHDTEGCPVTGIYNATYPDKILESRKMRDQLTVVLEDALSKGQVFWNVVKKEGLTLTS